MAQIKTGNVQVINGSAVVTGLPSVQEWNLIQPGAIFSVVGADQTYQINAVNLATTPPTLTLATPYVGATNTSTEGVAYCITNDFTPNFKLPLMARGDLETAALFSRAMQKIDSAIGMRLVSSFAVGASINAGTGVVTVTLPNHNLITDQVITVTEAVDSLSTPSASAINGSHIITVTSPNSFTYVVNGIAAATVTSPPRISYRSAISLGPTYSQPSHNFVVGTALRYDAASGFTPASSTGGESNGLVVGIVSSVSGSSFTLASSGAVYGLVGLSNPLLPKGTTLYVGSSGSPVNLTSSPPTAGQLRIPIFVVGSHEAADGSVFGHIVNFPTGQVPTMAGSTELLAGAGGAVPAPPASAVVKFLTNRGEWATAEAPASSVRFGNLDQSPAFDSFSWAADAGKPVPTASVHGALMNLHHRVSLVETSGANFRYAKFFLTVGAGSFTVPTGVTRIRVWLWGAGSTGSSLTNNFGSTFESGSTGAFVQAEMSVTPGTLIPLQVGSAVATFSGAPAPLAASVFGLNGELYAGGGYYHTGYFQMSSYTGQGVAVVADTIPVSDRILLDGIRGQIAKYPLSPTPAPLSAVMPPFLAYKSNAYAAIVAEYGAFHIDGFGFADGSVYYYTYNTGHTSTLEQAPPRKREGAVIVEW